MTATEVAITLGGYLALPPVAFVIFWFTERRARRRIERARTALVAEAERFALEGRNEALRLMMPNLCPRCARWCRNAEKKARAEMLSRKS